MLPRPVVARWRTSLAAAAVVLVATACGHTEAGPPGGGDGDRAEQAVSWRLSARSR